DRAAAALARTGGSPRYPIEFPSQFGEDMLLWDLFGGKTSGFFIEVGAHDGHSDAISYPFEAVGWTGLLVEPLPDRYKECAARRTTPSRAGFPARRQTPSGAGFLARRSRSTSRSSMLKALNSTSSTASTSTATAPA